MVLGIDPGSITGVAAFVDGSFAWSFQDEARPALVRLYQTLHAVKPTHDVVEVVIEAAYVGRGKAASLAVAESCGDCRTVVWMAGYGRAPWRPAASEWREPMGFALQRVVDVGTRKKSIAADRRDLEEQARAIASSILPVSAAREFKKSQTHEAEAICMAKAGWQRFLSRLAVSTNQLRER